MEKKEKKVVAKEVKIIRAYGANDAICHEVNLEKLDEFMFERGGERELIETLMDSYKGLLDYAIAELKKWKKS